jgi:hypothetical protein
MDEFYDKFKSLVDPWNQYEYISLRIYSGWCQHLCDVCFLPICNSCCCLCICCCCNSLYEQSGVVIQKGQCEISGTVREIFIEQGKYLRYYRPRFRRGQHDIGIWTTETDFPGSSLLLHSNDLKASKDFLSSSTFLSDRFICQTQSISKLVTHYQGDPTSTPHIDHCPEEISRSLLLLRDLVEESYQKSLRSSSSSSVLETMRDYKLFLSPSDLESALGNTIASQLYYYFLHQQFPHTDSATLTPFPSPSLSRGRHIDQIILRRSSVQGQCIPFHLDTSFRTMQISLNSWKETEGGELMYLFKNQCLIPKREVGTITIHENDLVHGVREMRSGVRFGLFLIQKVSFESPTERES